jgi:uncharacterized protein Yka (UPF0111/DUF47 family)
MAGETAIPLSSRIASETATYTDQISECVSLVATLLDRYATGEPHRETAERIRAIESDCDETVRRTTALIADASVDDVGLRNTRLHLNTPPVVEMYQRLDEVANAAETVANDVVTTGPPTAEPYAGRFREMAEHATAAMAALADAVRTVVELLCDPTRTGSIADAVGTVRDAESACDRLRNEATAAAFADESLDCPLLVRAFAGSLDALVDAMEDVTDQLRLVSSTEAWLTAEPDRAAENR